MIPDHLMRYPTRAGQEALAARLNLHIDPFDQDWEWQIADASRFHDWIAIYKDNALSDDERYSLMEILIQCVEDICNGDKPVEQFLEWQAVEALLLANGQLHASTIYYWSVFGHDDPDEQFRVSAPMRRVWAKVQQSFD
jgi:hypothetical protein